MPTRFVVLTAVAVMMAAYHPQTVAQQKKPATEVINAAGSVLDVEVTNLPSTQTVDGEVSISNLPAVQNVSGQVMVGNFPATQAVSGTVSVTGPVSVAGPLSIVPFDGVGHLGVPLYEHRVYSQTAGPTIDSTGLVRFSAIQPSGGGASAALAPGQCLVLLDLDIAFRTYERVSPGAIGIQPQASAYFEIGMAGPTGTGFNRFLRLAGFSNDHAQGTIRHSLEGGVILRTTVVGGDTLDRLAVRTVAQGGNDEFYPYVLAASGSGYVTDCP